MSEQPRLLYCCFDVLPGPNGLSRRITEYLKGVADRFQVVVLSTKTPDHSHIERYHGARLLRVPVGGGDLQSRIQAFDRAVRRQLESEEYVIAHFFDPFGGYALCESRAQYGFRLIYDAQTFSSQELRYTHPATEGDRRFLSKVRRQELFCLMNADAVVCGSEATRDWVLSLGAPPMSMHVFRQLVDLQSYTKEIVGKPDGTPMKLLHLGSQLPYQGLETLLRAMQLALRQADLRLIVVGPKVPEGQAPYDELVTELKLTGKVEFRDPVKHDELPHTLAACDVGMLTLDESDRNRSQGGPLAKVGEYLAAGRPVIASDLPIVRELVPEAARLLFPPNDFKALAEILVKLASDAALRVELGAKAREAAVHFDASAARGKLLDLYEHLSTRGKTGGPQETQSEVTELRATGSSDTGRIVARSQEERPPGDTLDEEPAVVVGEELQVREKPEDRARAAVTEPGVQSPLPPEPTPIVKAKRKKKGASGTDEFTPIRSSEAASEPTPITSARQRRSSSKGAAKAAAPPLPPVEAADEPSQPFAQPPSERTPIFDKPPAAVGPVPEAPVRIRRSTEGKGIRSPELPPASLDAPVVTLENPVPPEAVAAPPPAPPAEPHAEGPVRIRRTTEGKGVRSPFAPPAPAPPPNPPEPPQPAPDQAQVQTLPNPDLMPSLPSVMIELDAGLPKLKRGDESREVRETSRIPILTPSHGARPIEKPADELPRIVRSVPVRHTDQIPVLVPRPPLEVTVAPPALELPPPPLPPPPVPAPVTVQIPVLPPPLLESASGPHEISSDEIDSIEEPAQAGGLSPWLAHVLFGYCPPEAVPFVRPPPPTTFPGRET